METGREPVIVPVKYALFPTPAVRATVLLDPAVLMFVVIVADPPLEIFTPSVCVPPLIEPKLIGLENVDPLVPVMMKLESCVPLLKLKLLVVNAEAFAICRVTCPLRLTVPTPVQLVGFSVTV
jgi:hypothetical protein